MLLADDANATHIDNENENDNDDDVVVMVDTTTTAAAAERPATWMEGSSSSSRIRAEEPCTGTCGKFLI
jgi:hypothetical protein